MATYVVGDIQGCFSGLKTLLNVVSFEPEKDTLIAVGDLIGRGPESLATLDYLYSLGESFDSVLGNHDLHLLAISCGIRQAKPNDKLDSLLASPNLKTYIEWLRFKPLAMSLNNSTLITHAGLYPQWSIQQALALSHECCTQLQGDNWPAFLNNMYGNKPAKWSQKLTENDRWRFIVNAFTRMRYMVDANTLEFKCKDAPQHAPPSLIPWFTMANKQLLPEQKIIFGHWATLNGQTNQRQYVALDTGYIWKNSLTLLDINNSKKYSVSYQD